MKISYQEMKVRASYLHVKAMHSAQCKKDNNM